jgi:hypothetical protein
MGSGESVFEIERSVEGEFTMVCSVELLFEGTGSLSLPETLAVLLIIPVESAVTSIEIVAVVPLDKLPKSHVTVPPTSPHDP